MNHTFPSTVIVPLKFSRASQKYFIVFHGVRAGELPWQLNVVDRNNVREPPSSNFWLNAGRDGAWGDTAYNALLDLDLESVVRLTGRTRMERSVRGALIECPEFEVLIPEDEFVRQCYYCLAWDNDGDRHHKLINDLYWCSCVRLICCFRSSPH